MGYNRSKSKTSRRVKRAKTNKRNNKRKQTFRKSRRVNRGGKGPEKRMQEDDGNYRDEKRNRKDYVPGSMIEKMLQNKKNNNNDPHNQAKLAHENENDKKNEMKRVANVSKNMYLMPTAEGEVVDQTEQTEITKMQNNFEDDVFIEGEGEGEGEEKKKLTGRPILIEEDEEMTYRRKFGGKKKRATRRK